MSESKKHQIKFRIRYAETDQMGFVHHAAYWPWLEEGRTAWLREMGYSYADLEAKGQLLVIVDGQMRYRKPAKYDQEVLVETRLSSVGRAKIYFEYEVRCPETGDVFCEAKTLLGSINRDGRPTAMVDELRSALAARVRSTMGEE